MFQQGWSAPAFRRCDSPRFARALQDYIELQAERPTVERQGLAAVELEDLAVTEVAIRQALEEHLDVFGPSSCHLSLVQCLRDAYTADLYQPNAGHVYIMWEHQEL